jgi:hypothetical protein
VPETYELACPNPACPGREVDGEAVSRETWESRWLGQTAHEPGMWATPECPECGTEGVEASNEQLLDREEEALGRRCEGCGVVTANPDGGCPHCGEAFPEQTLPTEKETP